MENQEPQYEEIDLREYIKVLWNRKWSIITIFLIAVVLSAIISLLTPPTYQATGIIEVGKIKGKAIQSVSEIKSVLEKDTTLDKLRTKLKDPLDLTDTTSTNAIKSRFNVKQVENGETKSQLIEISGKANTPKKAALVVDKVSNLLLSYHDGKFAPAKETFESELNSIKQEKDKVETDIKQDIKTLKEKKIKVSRDISQLNDEIDSLEQDVLNYEREINVRSNITSEGQGRMVESYIDLVDKNKQRIKDKQQKISDLKQDIVEIDQKIKEKESSLKGEMAHYEEKIQQKEFERKYKTTPTKVEIVASPPETRIAPKRKLNVLIAAVLGGFIGILYAFGAEYFSDEEDREEINKEIDQEIIEE